MPSMSCSAGCLCGRIARRATRRARVAAGAATRCPVATGGPRGTLHQPARPGTGDGGGDRDAMRACPDRGRGLRRDRLRALDRRILRTPRPRPGLGALERRTRGSRARRRASPWPRPRPGPLPASDRSRRAIRMPQPWWSAMPMSSRRSSPGACGCRWMRMHVRGQSRFDQRDGAMGHGGGRCFG